MIYAIIYLESNEIAEEIAQEFLLSGLAASASIDIDNRFMIVENKKIVKSIHIVLTLQTKALLFTKINDYVVKKLGKDVPVFTLPITHSNDYFYHFLKENTQKV